MRVRPTINWPAYISPFDDTPRPAAVVATPSQISALTEIPAVSIGITAVGTTFPGSNLAVFIYS